MDPQERIGMVRTPSLQSKLARKLSKPSQRSEPTSTICRDVPVPAACTAGLRNITTHELSRPPALKFVSRIFVSAWNFPGLVRVDWRKCAWINWSRGRGQRREALGLPVVLHMVCQKHAAAGHTMRRVIPAPTVLVLNVGREFRRWKYGSQNLFVRFSINCQLSTRLPYEDGDLCVWRH